MSELAREITQEEFEIALPTRLHIGELAVGQICSLYTEVYTDARGFWCLAAAIDPTDITIDNGNFDVSYIAEYEKLKGNYEAYSMLFNRDSIAKNTFKGRILRSFISNEPIGNWNDSLVALMDSELTLSIR